MLQSEPESARLVAALQAAGIRRISAATLVETGIAMQARYGDHGER